MKIPWDYIGVFGFFTLVFVVTVYVITTRSPPP